MKIKYNGSYPNLCSGKLIVEVDDKVWHFPEFCLSSGGECYIESDGSECVEQGPWTIIDYPKDFPENLKEELTALVNKQVPWGCCGGCI